MGKKCESVEFLTAKDVAELTGYKMTMAGNIIRSLNMELERLGFLTFRGRVLASYFAKRVGCYAGKEEEELS